MAGGVRVSYRLALSKVKEWTAETITVEADERKGSLLCLFLDEPLAACRATKRHRIEVLGIAAIDSRAIRP